MIVSGPEVPETRMVSVSDAADQRVRPAAAVEDVLAGAAVELVVARSADQDIVATFAVQIAVGRQVVIAQAAVHHEAWSRRTGDGDDGVVTRPRVHGDAGQPDRSRGVDEVDGVRTRAGVDRQVLFVDEFNWFEGVHQDATAAGQQRARLIGDDVIRL